MAQFGHGDRQRKKTGEDDSYHIAQLALETEEERRAKIELDLIFGNEIRVKKTNKKLQEMS